MPALTSEPRVRGAAAPAAIDAALLETWALSYLERYASSAAQLQRVLQRRVRRRLGADRERVGAADALILALVARYREARLLDDDAYAAARARRDIRRGRSLRHIAAGLAAKGVGAAAAVAAIGALRDGTADPELVAAVAFARRRRFGPFRTREGNRDTELAAFARAGFSRAAAAAVLGCADAAAVATLLAGNDRR
ncbi:MAG TPA: RecX family transcriptional regulator [Stellaceae bacterium]|nr:RecX family transcriptional regulator [Stellaceae bacterium]